MISSGALAIFVKTPGLSRVKTRLASSIGEESAIRFYKLSIIATAAIARRLKETISDLHVYWSVAEAEGIHAPIWKEFPRIHQGEGTLGDRLGLVYNQLLQRHSHVCFIGADSPHLTVQEIGGAISRTSLHNSFVMGETVDGGFYFFGGSTYLPRDVWRAVEYSSAHTSKQLKDAVHAFGRLEVVDKSFDIDTIEDLNIYREHSLLSPDLLPEQREVIAWVQGLK